MKPIRILLTAMLATLLVLGIFSGGIIAGLYIPDKMIAPLNLPGLTAASTPTVDGKPVSREDLFKPFWQAWDLVHADFVEQPVDDEKMMQGAIRGMMDSLVMNIQHTWTKRISSNVRPARRRV